MYGSTRIGIRKPVAGESSQQVGFSAGYSGLLFANEAYGALPPVFNCTDGCALNRKAGKKEYEFTNHLGNVLETVTDIHLPNGNAALHTVDYYVSDVIGYSDYFVFGSAQSNRVGGDYRYAFNGQELDEEVGEGMQTAMFWEYDSRLGRRWNVDPKGNASSSRYSCFNDNPLGLSDVNGDSAVINSMGYVLHYDKDDKDLRVFMRVGGEVKLVGELGDQIDATHWFKNLLDWNSAAASQIQSPLTFRNKVQQDGPWDYKNLNESNDRVNDGTYRTHILGVAFFRKDKERNPNADLGDTWFKFDGKLGRAEDLNNFHYGVVGKACGLFPDEMLLRMPGKAEMEKRGTVPESWTPRVPNFVPNPIVDMSLMWPFGDNPIDQIWIIQGMIYYDIVNKEAGTLRTGSQKK